MIDPGPDLPEHVAALPKALAGTTVSHILVTHTHAEDHILAAFGRNAPDDVAFPPLAIAIMKFGVDPLHTGEVQPHSHGLGDKVAHELLRHQWMGEQAVIEGIGTGHELPLSRQGGTVTSRRQSR